MRVAVLVASSAHTVHRSRIINVNSRRSTGTIYHIFLPVALQPSSDLGRQIVEVSRAHTIGHTHTHTHPVGFLCTSDQPVADAATYTTHNKHNRWITIPAIKRLQT